MKSPGKRLGTRKTGISTTAYKNCEDFPTFFTTKCAPLAISKENRLNLLFEFFSSSRDRLTTFDRSSGRSSVGTVRIASSSSACRTPDSTTTTCRRVSHRTFSTTPRSPRPTRVQKTTLPHACVRTGTGCVHSETLNRAVQRGTRNNEVWRFGKSIKFVFYDFNVSSQRVDKNIGTVNYGQTTSGIRHGH